MDKSYYDKKVVYLDYMESEEKIRNGGFVKWEVRGEECRIQIHIRGLYPTDTLQGDIVLFGGAEDFIEPAFKFAVGGRLFVHECVRMSDKVINFAFDHGKGGIHETAD